MNQEQSILNDIRRELTHFAPKLRGHRVVLFGSRSRKSSRARSDFDIGIVGKKPLDLKVFFELEDRFDDLPTLHNIDLVDFSRTSKGFRDEALKSTKTLFPL